MLKAPLDATPEQVKTAFRKRAKEVHPDTSERSDTQEEFVALTAGFKLAMEHAHHMQELRANNPHQQSSPTPHPSSSSYWFDWSTTPFNPREAEEVIETVRYEMTWNEQITSNSGPDWGGYFWMMQMQGADADTGDVSMKDVRTPSHVRADSGGSDADPSRRS